METLTVGQAAARSGWSPRMLRYVERLGLVVPARAESGYRLYGLAELNQLRSLAELRGRCGLALDELAFAARLRRDASLRTAVDGWLAGSEQPAAWVEWSSESTSGCWPPNRREEELRRRRGDSMSRTWRLRPKA